eukprot:SAG11_NODE_6618_length_1278_cov_1.273113_1_plen_31_part_01
MASPNAIVLRTLYRSMLKWCRQPLVKEVPFR